MHEAKQRRSINQWASVMTRNFVLLQDETHLPMKLIFVRNRGSTSQSKLCFPPITVFTLHLSNAEASLSLSLSLSLSSLLFPSPYITLCQDPYLILLQRDSSHFPTLLNSLFYCYHIRVSNTKSAHLGTPSCFSTSAILFKHFIS